MSERRHMWSRMNDLEASPELPPTTEPLNQEQLNQEQLNQEQLHEIRLRERRASKGPWVVRQHIIDEFVTDRSITTTWEDPSLQWPQSIVGVHQSAHGIGSWIDEDNAKFIAAARTDIPNLLSTLDIFAHPKVYEALLRFSKSEECQGEDKRAIEQALDAAWGLIKSRR
jgi:hypothetical protein